MNLDNFQKISKNLDSDQKLIAVSKGQEVKKIQILYEAGQRDFGENFLQELVEKKNKLPSDIVWHFLGNIQSNKLKDIVNYADLVQSIGRKRIYDKLINMSDKLEKNILLQLKLGNEASKSGFSKSEINNIIENHPKDCAVKIKGLMVIAEGGLAEMEINNQFAFANDFFRSIKQINEDIEYLSMGMSNDYDIALTNGSNMIRIGTSLFGSRNK